MASRKTFVNLSRPNTTKAGGGSSKNTVERTQLEIIATNLASASKDRKLVSYWKKSQEVKHTKIVWFVKDREGEQHLQIYLYANIPNDSGSYEVLGKLLDTCLIPDTEVVYVLT